METVKDAVVWFVVEGFMGIFVLVCTVCLTFLVVFVVDRWEKRERRKAIEKKMKKTGLPKKCWHCPNLKYGQKVCCEVCIKEG